MFILTISGHDIFKPLDNYFRPFTNSGHDTNHHKRCTKIWTILSFLCNYPVLHIPQCNDPGIFLGIIGWDPSVSKSDWVTCWHLSILFTNVRYVLKVPLEWLVNFLKSWTSTGYSQTSPVSSTYFERCAGNWCQVTVQLWVSCPCSNQAKTVLVITTAKWKTLFDIDYTIHFIKVSYHQICWESYIWCDQGSMPPSNTQYNLVLHSCNSGCGTIRTSLALPLWPARVEVHFRLCLGRSSPVF